MCHGPVSQCPMTVSGPWLWKYHGCHAEKPANVVDALCGPRPRVLDRTVDVDQHLVAVRVESSVGNLWAPREPDILQVPQECMDRGSPWTGDRANGGADTRGVTGTAFCRGERSRRVGAGHGSTPQWWGAGASAAGTGIQSRHVPRLRVHRGGLFEAAGDHGRSLPPMAVRAPRQSPDERLPSP